MRPLIGVTTSELRPAHATSPGPQGEPRLPEMALGMDYLRAIERAGGLPVVLPPVALDAVEQLLDRLDGVCLSGGPDLDPHAYGAADRHPELGATEPALDGFELALARAADDRGLPLLGVCRGSQALNVARGGTLHQHIPDVVGDEITHRQPRAPGEPIHGVTVAHGSRLATILGHRHLQVNSFHHQAVDTLGERLTITARAEDGTVEAFESAGSRFVVGVQWHAECLVDHDEQAALFAALVDASAERAAAIGGELSALQVADSA